VLDELAKATVPSIPTANRKMIVMFFHFSIIVLLSNRLTKIRLHQQEQL
jgi:hypothetical protein